MRISRTTGLVLASLVTLCLALAVVPASAQNPNADPCAPGQPPDRGPGVPPGSGQPSGRPPYPPGKCELRLSSGTAAQGGTLTVAGDGFAPGEEVTLRLNGAILRSVMADASGSFTAEVTIPRNAALGASKLTATSATQVLSASLEVTAAAANEASRSAESRSAAGLLSRTGADVIVPVAAGIGLLAVGGGLVLAARRRRALPAT